MMQATHNPYIEQLMSQAILTPMSETETEAFKNRLNETISDRIQQASIAQLDANARLELELMADDPRLTSDIILEFFENNIPNDEVRDRMKFIRDRITQKCPDKDWNDFLKFLKTRRDEACIA